MESRNFWKTISTDLAVLTVIIILVTGSASAVSYKTLHRFTGGVDGNTPFARLTLDTAGNLYGTTGGGGNLDCRCGTVFKLTRNADGSWAEQVLYTFDVGAGGRNPRGGLVLDAIGNLYGTTDWGGDLGEGVAFKLTRNADGSWAEHLLHSFGGYSDENPAFDLIFDETGNLYGTTLGEGREGTVFQLVPNADGTWTENTLHTFLSGDPAEVRPFAGLVRDAAGNLYGTTSPGDEHEYGSVFKLAPNPDATWTLSVLHRFTGGKDGGAPGPGADLILDAAGNVYGTTWYGGTGSHDSPSGSGVVFKLTPNPDGTWTEHVLHMFTCGKAGSLPNGVISDAAGNLYGTTLDGGAYGYGTVFKLYRIGAGGWAKKVLWSFRDQPGANPYVGLVLDRAGNLYGTTLGDGTSTFGTVFEITP
jgi:uncharacterized repeat protein (TIGR03803 family)